MEINLKKLLPKITWKESIQVQVQPDASFSDYTNIQPAPFGGEKTPYELGNPINFSIDYYTLRARAWESYIKSDVVQNAIRKYVLWIVGAGLKLQSNPEVRVLQKYGTGITENESKEFIEDSESLFRLYAKSKFSVYSKEYNLHKEAGESLKNALLAGDILCVSRYDGNRVSMETIDGYHVQQPVGSDFIDDTIKRGNKIIDGVEIDKTGNHVAYYVCESMFKYIRIPAYGKKTRFRQAWLMYGLRHKKSDVRGMSLLTAVIETATVMDRYKDATVSGAEENAKIPYTIEHNQFSDGENPMMDQLKQSVGKGAGTAPETQSYIDSESVATKIAQTTKTSTYNMPIGSKFNRHKGSSDSGFGEFFGVNIDIIYATLGIPPEVAMDKFGGAYSGSRAALKSWEFKMMVDRTNTMKEDFYKPLYDYWLNFAILDNLIQAPGYLQALNQKNFMVLEAYRNCRFIGVTVPHIDPVKEVSAERLKLGEKFKTVPLSTAEQSMENLNTGDYNQVIKKTEDEIKVADSFISDDSDNSQ